ncbi:MAG: phage terminase large subunit [Rickettsiales bacterium]
MNYEDQNEYDNFHKFLPNAFNAINPGREFHDNWHLEAICKALNDVYFGDIKRLIINMPPRALKSMTVNVAWPAWVMGRDSTRRIISASYSQFLSFKHAIDSKLLIESEYFKNLFPELQISNKMNKREKFMTTQNGYRFSTSIGGSVTGEGGDILIVDDPHNALYVHSIKRRKYAIDWFQQSFTSRLDDKKKGRIVIVMQRLHQDDLTGFLLKNQKDNWVHLNIPAIANDKLTYDLGRKFFVFEKGEFLHDEREGKEELDRTRQELGDASFAAQYLQKPLQLNEGMIKKSWFRYYDASQKPKFDSVMLSWDTALKASDHNSYSVCTCWGKLDKDFYLIDVIRKKLEYPDLKKEIISSMATHSPDLVLIEDKASGQSLIQDFRHTKEAHYIVPIVPNKDKITRFARCTQFFESRRVYLPKNAPWLFDYEEELLLFPSGSNDDQVDSTSQFLNYMLNRVEMHFRCRQL